MNPRLRVALHQQMHVIGHDFDFQNLGTSSIADFANDLFPRFIDGRQKNLPAIFRAPDYMKFTGVDRVAVGFVRHWDNGERGVYSSFLRHLAEIRSEVQGRKGARSPHA